MRSFVAVLAAAASFQRGSAAPFGNEHTSHPSLSRTGIPYPTGGHHHHHPTGTGGFPYPTGGFHHTGGPRRPGDHGPWVRDVEDHHPHPTGHHSGGAYPSGHHGGHHSGHAYPTGGHHTGGHHSPTTLPIVPTGRYPHPFGEKHKKPWGYPTGGFPYPSGGEHHHHPTHPTGGHHHHHPSGSGSWPHPTGYPTGRPSHHPGHKESSATAEPIAEPTAVEKRSDEHRHPPFSPGGAHPTGVFPPHHHPSGGFPHHHPSGGFPHPTGRPSHHSGATTTTSTSTASAAQPTGETEEEQNENEKRSEQGPGPVIWPNPSRGFPTSPFHLPTFHPYPTGGHPHPTGRPHHHPSGSVPTGTTSRLHPPAGTPQVQHAREILQEVPRVVQEVN
ncbi:hypothetical protein F4776DRAFT_327515 [Hypoxylon sp. NC0597]|nr:hypothetical protein F4776DRAFT_327515 [Hypoxylon sp. NC0597]